MSYKKSSFKPALGFEKKVLSAYKHQIRVQSILQRIIKESLPKHLADHVLYCVVSEKIITLYTDSSTWSSQLRFYQETILLSLAESNKGDFEELKVKLIPKENEVQAFKTSVIRPSKESIDNILSQAENQSDDRLKHSLLRLSKTLKNLK